MFYTVDLMASRSIGGFELAIVLTVGMLRDDAYGVAVRAAVSKRLGRDCSIGAVYTTLQRLENKGLVESWTEEPTPVRGGRAKRYFRVTVAGQRAVREAQATAERLWRNPGRKWPDASNQVGPRSRRGNSTCIAAVRRVSARPSPLPP